MKDSVAPRIDCRRDDAAALLAELRAKLSPRGDVISPASRQKTIDVFGQALSPQQVVERICRDVQASGIDAVLDYSRRVDRSELTADSIRVPADELAAAHKQADPEFLACLGRIRENIFLFQRAIRPDGVITIRRKNGATLQHRYTPLERVGLCIPGGAAAYPSTVLMTAVPAQAAGVRELAVVAPPTPFGSYNADLLATCHELGITEVYRVGGAQAVAALAYGAGPIRRVDKIVGPGNLFVALAKKYVYGEVDIDSIAGPSEVVVLAGPTARADFAAADLIAQAEHSPGASLLITWSERLADEVDAELARQLALVDRGDLAADCLRQFGAIVLATDANEAVRLANEIAPEHLHLACDEAASFLSKLNNAGAVFVGPYSPVAVGDYVAGPSHVLPTSGTARWASGLSSLAFLRSSSVIEYTKAGLQNVADDLRRLAHVEGLSAHAASVDVRLDAKDHKK